MIRVTCTGVKRSALPRRCESSLQNKESDQTVEYLIRRIMFCGSFVVNYPYALNVPSASSRELDWMVISGPQRACRVVWRFPNTSKTLHSVCTVL